MNWLQTIRTRRLPAIAAHSALWAVPWTCVLVLSTTVASAADQGIVGSPWFAPPRHRAAPVAIVANASMSTDTVVMLSSVVADGTQVSVVCHTSPDRISTDVLALSPEVMANVVAHLCKPSSEAVLRLVAPL
jgi:hypothetical protein